MFKLTAVMLVAMLTAATCGEESQMQASIQDVKAKHEAELMATPGVVSVGIGRDSDGRAVIIVGVERELPETSVRLPEAIDGYPVHTEVVGRVRAQ